jgi:hypothetical protein
VLSASANKLTKLKEQAEEYAALIMEELDVDQMGYIEVHFYFFFFFFFFAFFQCLPCWMESISYVL